MKKIFKVADIKSLEKQVALGEISYSRMIEVLNEMANDSLNESSNTLNTYKATVVANNSCYVETVLVIAENEEQANDILCVHEKRKVQYKSKLKEIIIDKTKPNVIGMVGFGENESIGGYFED